MDSHRYQRLSLRTVPRDLQYWRIDYESEIEGPRAHLMTNCTLGMAGEAAEIAEFSSSDEIGDGYWYGYIMLWTLDVEGYEPSPRSSVEPTTGAFLAAGKACELVKKHVFHGRPFDEIQEMLVRATRRYLDALAALDDQTPAETFDQNVRKLESRYPDGFFERG